MEVARLISESVVCVLDADPAVRDSLASVISLDGIEVCSFATATELRAVLRLESAPEIRCILCASELPDASGLALYCRLREDGLNVPFALMVSRHAGVTRRAAEEAGVNLVLPKPLVDPENVLQFVREPVA